MLEPSNEGDVTFLRELVRRLRALGGVDAWDGRSESEVLAPLIRERRAPEPGDLDPEVYLRIQLFYEAVATLIEARTGVACTPMLRMYQEGFGRVVVIAGRLVVVSRSFGDAARFGFDSVDKLVDAGERLVRSGVEMIARFREVADHA
jgi:probable nitrogen fixation protein